MKHFYKTFFSQLEEVALFSAVKLWLHFTCFQCMPGYCSIFIIHWILTWARGSLNVYFYVMFFYVYTHKEPQSIFLCDVFSCVYIQGTTVYSLIWRTFFVVGMQFDPRGLSEHTQRLAHNGHLSMGQPGLLCLTLAFHNECSCSALLSLILAWNISLWISGNQCNLKHFSYSIL